MGSFDDRLLRVGIQIDGQMRYYDDLRIVARGTLYANELNNEATVTIYNLAADVRNYILTQVTPYNFLRSPKRLIIEAGRSSTGYYRLFSGDIQRAQASQPPEIALTMSAISNQFATGAIVARSMLSTIKLSTLAARIASDIGVGLVFQATDTNVENYQFAGATIRQVGKLNQIANVNAFVEDGTLYVKDVGKPLQNVEHVLSANSGMIGVPEQTEHGVRVKYLLDPKTKLGGRLTIDSKFNPGCNGKFIIFKVDFDIANRDVPFYNTVEGRREGYI